MTRFLAHYETVSGGSTTTDAGGASGEWTASGADVLVMPDAGSAIGIWIASGADILALIDTGGAAGEWTGAGADVQLMVDAGGGVVIGVPGGTDGSAPPVINTAFNGDAYVYDSVGATGSVTGGTILDGPNQTSPIGSVTGGTVLPGPNQISATGSVTGGTIMNPEKRYD